MEVYALIGASGTGKSHNANSVMEQYHIDMMIDHGLLIKEGKKMAGTSAKAEETTVAAVKRAIFHDPIHAAEVRERIGQLQPKKILIRVRDYSLHYEGGPNPLFAPLTFAIKRQNDSWKIITSTLPLLMCCCL